MLSFVRKKRIYLDYAAATPVRKEVLDAMQPFWNTHFGNAGSIHAEGVYAENALSQARVDIGKILHVRAEDLYFTGSGTESNNIAILGTIEARKVSGTQYADMEVITTAIEHPSIIRTLAYLQEKGVVVKYAPLDEEGCINVQKFSSLLSEKTVLVSVAYANSEIGVIQDVSKIARLAHSYAKEHNSTLHVHVDAAQAPLWLGCGMDVLSADILSLDAGKCYGPKGVGVLAVRHTVELQPYFFGGGQERGLRPGTENIPLVVGCAASLAYAQEEFEKQSIKVSRLRDYGIELLTSIDGVTVNGPIGKHRIANNINIAIEGIDGEFAVICLDQEGIACSTKSACGSGDGKGSSVVAIVRKNPDFATASIRFSLGEETTKKDIEYLFHTLKAHIIKMRRATH